MSEPRTREEVAVRSESWIARLTPWKRRFVRGLQNEITDLREQVRVARQDPWRLAVFAELQIAKDEVKDAREHATEPTEFPRAEAIELGIRRVIAAHEKNK